MLSDEVEFVPSFDVVLAVARLGDGLAFERLYAVLHRRVHAYARVRGHRDPEGLVNDVFLQVFRSLSTFEGTEAQFKAWVFTIARNKMVDDARRRSRRPLEVGEEEAVDHPLVAVDDVEELAISNVSADSLLRHLDVLTGDQRDVLILRIVSDLTVETVAEVLGKQVGAVKALQRRAFRALARSMEADGRTPTSDCVRSR